MSKLLLVLVGLVTVVTASACRKQTSEPAPEPSIKPAEGTAARGPETLAAEAQNLFGTRCVVCHGNHGAGDGPGAVALNPKPRAFSVASWQASVDDARLAKVIVEGGPAVGLAPAMPPNPDLVGKPAVVSELVKIVRGFAK